MILKMQLKIRTKMYDAKISIKKVRKPTIQNIQLKISTKTYDAKISIKKRYDSKYSVNNPYENVQC